MKKLIESIISLTQHILLFINSMYTNPTSGDISSKRVTATVAVVNAIVLSHRGAAYYPACYAFLLFAGALYGVAAMSKT